MFIVLYMILQYMVYVNSQPCPHFHADQIISLFDAHICHFYFHSFFFLFDISIINIIYFYWNSSHSHSLVLSNNDFSKLIKNCSMLFSTLIAPYNMLFHLLNPGYLLLLLLVLLLTVLLQDYRVIIWIRHRAQSFVKTIL